MVLFNRRSPSKKIVIFAKEVHDEKIVNIALWVPCAPGWKNKSLLLDHALDVNLGVRVEPYLLSSLLFEGVVIPFLVVLGSLVGERAFNQLLPKDCHGRFIFLHSATSLLRRVATILPQSL